MDSIKDIIQVYNSIVKDIDKDAHGQDSRAYGGVIRSAKGKLQEYISEEIVKIAWQNIGAKADRLEINSNKIKIPIKDSYIENIANQQVKEYILEHKKDYYYGLSVDKHVFVDNQLVMGIECKAYTENAMLKRILVDFHLLKTLYPNISCYLFQLESQLGGDYSALPETPLGSKPTHSIMSYFESVNLNIVTLLKGERDINQPIHKNFKPLEEENLKKTIKLMENELKVYL
ncbi:restriction endonuclease [Helicobacter pylori]|uniref:restriction endonuclease n=1 Tax=Helicobacter pylori TaxID=210 RepID=UPI000EAF793F|nr:restriction endonuclease [Helicobacter pylori]RKV02954.1 restriction endonuclease [Helicobacter pylori]WQX55253.1 restriction endonuclease [Helicobacter pylori]